MKYDFNGKTLNIPDEWIDNFVDHIDGATIQDAIDTWLEDNDYIVSPETVALQEKAKANRKDIMKNGKSMKERKKVERVRKPNEDKRTIISWLKVLFEGFALNGEIENVAVANIEREVTFVMGDVTYSVTLTAHRKPKEGGK